MLYETAAAACAAVAGGMLWWWKRTGNELASLPTAHSHPHAALPSPPSWAPHDVLPVVDGARLLARPSTAQLVRSIISKSGLSGSNVERDLLPIIEAYASFVQMLPASESHHHAQPGGLLQHTLEVVDFSLSYRRSYMLPLGAGAERVNELKHVWTMACILVSMFHDIGKPMSDLVVTLYATHGVAREGRIWTPLAGPMSSQGATHYQVNFNRERRYEQHAELSVILMQRMVPSHILAWIGEQDRSLLPLILGSLAPGDSKAKSILADITRRADQESTRVNLLNGPRTRFKTARETPLVDVLDEALKRLIASSRLRFNVPGGHGFVDGEDLLLVVPRVLDEIRAYLADALVTGSRGIPQDNLILYSTWMDFGRVLPQPGLAKADGTQGPPRAVWRVRVQGIPSTLTVLRFPRSSPALAELAEQWPASYTEPISVVVPEEPESALPLRTETPTVSLELASDDASGSSERAEAEPLPESVANDASRAPATAPSLPDFLLEMPSPRAAVEAGSEHQLPTPASTSINSASLLAAERDVVDQLQGGGGLVTSPEENPLRQLLTRAAVPVPTTARSIPTMKIKSPAAKTVKSELLEQFEDWLRLGLRSGHVPYNNGQSMVHFHKTTVSGAEQTVALFVTPALYQRFAKERDPALAQSALSEIPRASWLPVQSALLKAHPHRKEHQGKISKTIFRFATKSGGVFGANVLTDPVAIFGVVPEPNPYIGGEVQDAALSSAIKPTQAS